MRKTQQKNLLKKKPKKEVKEQKKKEEVPAATSWEDIESFFTIFFNATKETQEKLDFARQDAEFFREDLVPNSMEYYLDIMDGDDECGEEGEECEDDECDEENEKGCPHSDPIFNAELLEESDLTYLTKSLRKCILKFDPKAEINIAESEKDGAEKAVKLAEMVQFCDRRISLFLRHPKGFSGRDLWDTLLSLDMTYEPDARLFCYDVDLGGCEDEGCEDENCDDDEEQDTDLKVITITANTDDLIKFFDPVLLAQKDFKMKSVLFNCYLPLAKDPLRTIKIMINAIKYAKKKTWRRYL